MNKTDFASYDRDFLQNLINECTSISEVLRKLNLKAAGANHVKLSKFLKESDLDTSTLVGRKISRYNGLGIPKKKLSEQLQENTSGNSNRLKERLIREGVKKCVCEYCGISEWNGMPISLELHHINGNHYDNRLENLIILCPNCHSQTYNFRGKNSNFDRELQEMAESNAHNSLKELLFKEEKRKNEIEANKIKWDTINHRPIKEKKYCEICGKEIRGGGKRFCSQKCCAVYNSQHNATATIEEILHKAKECTSLVELGKCFNITDNAIKHRFVKIGRFEELKQTLLPKTKQVKQLSLEGDILQIWDNAEIASKTLNIKRNNIIACCNKQRKTSNGFVWRYIDD